mgnify:CR=1 FL=1
MARSAQLLNRAPDWLWHFAHHVAAGRGVTGRVVDALRFRYTEDQVPPLPSVSDAAVRLLIGPANSAGQAFEWARAAERNLPGVTAVALRGLGTNSFRANVDVNVPVAVYQRATSWHAAFESFLVSQTHVMWESGLALLGRRYGSDPRVEMTKLDQLGVKVALLFHGSDVRPPSLHAAAHQWSPFRKTAGPKRALEHMSAKNLALANAVDAPVFVSTPDLLQWLPSAIWLPVVVDPEKWRVSHPTPRGDRRPVVVHAPSQPWLKGTDRVEEVLRRLEEEGLLEYRQLVGVPHASMPDFYADADIVLDQFALGIYGVAACEAMAAGRLVMSHVDEFTRRTVLERTGLELPVHEVTVETLESELRRAIADPGAFDGLRVSGPRFVEKVHNGRRSAEVMAEFLGGAA